MEDILHRKNVNFSCIDETDKDPKRLEKWKLQRDERGFDDTELWNFDLTIANFILPRLKVFREQTEGFPSKFNTIEEWYQILDEIIEGLELYKNKFDWDMKTDQNILNLYSAKSKKAFRLLGEYAQDLWW